MKRLATNRDFEDGSWEAIEIDHNGVFRWLACDKGLGAFSSFMATLEDVEEFFEKVGRKLDISRLPANYVVDPYKMYKR
jgi:hypothetical protein